MSANRFRFIFKEPHGTRTRGFEVVSRTEAPALVLATFAARKELPGWTLVETQQMPPPPNNVVPFPTRSARP
jgi:hypothetical protein